MEKIAELKKQAGGLGTIYKAVTKGVETAAPGIRKGIAAAKPGVTSGAKTVGRAVKSVAKSNPMGTGVALGATGALAGNALAERNKPGITIKAASINKIAGGRAKAAGGMLNTVKKFVKKNPNATIAGAGAVGGVAAGASAAKSYYDWNKPVNRRVSKVSFN